MLGGIYPQYVGPTVQYRYQSLYPRWLGNLLDVVVPQPIQDWLGGVIILDDRTGVAAVGGAIATLTLAAQSGVVQFLNRVAVTETTQPVGIVVQTVARNVIALSGILGAIYTAVKTGVLDATARTATEQKGTPSAEVSDEEPKI